ncbi:MAG: hypothetical protein ACAH11_00210 [Sphingomonas sp.]
MRRPLLTALALTAMPFTAQAQTAAPDLEGTMLTSGPAGSSDTVVDFGDVDFDLEVSEDESKASVQIGDYRISSFSNGQRNGQTSETWSLKLAVPVGGGDDLTSSDTLRSFSNGPELTFTFSWFGFAGADIDSGPYRDLSKPGGAARAGCIAASVAGAEAIGRAVAKADKFPDALLSARAMKAALKLDPDAPEGVLEAAFEAAAAARAAGTDPVAAAVAAAKGAAGDLNGNTGYCAPPGPPEPDFPIQYSGKSKAEINRMVFSSVWRFGFEGAIGVDRFAYVEPVTLAERNPGEAHFRAAIFGSIYPGDGVSALIGRVEYVNGYEGADEAVICKAVVIDPAADCVHGRPTPAAHVEKLNVSIEYRRYLGLDWRAGDLAISPKASFDTLGGDYELALPVFFVPAGDSSISPGFSITYSSKKDAVDFGLFLRKSFKF